MINIILYPGSHSVSMSVIRSLCKSYNIHVLAKNKQSCAIYSSKIKGKKIIGNFDQRRDKLIDEINNYYLQNIYPEKAILYLVDDEDLFYALKNRANLTESIIMPISDWKIVENIVDKSKLYHTLKTNKIPHPEIIDKFTINTAEDLINRKYILKPTYSEEFRKIFGRKAIKSSDVDFISIKKECDNLNIDYIIQEHIDGDGDLITVAGYSSKALDCSSTAMKKIHQYPVEFGTCRYGTTIKDKDIIIHAESIVRLMRYTGIFLAEFKVDDAGIARLIEINTRPGGWPERLAELTGNNILELAVIDFCEDIHAPKKSKKEIAQASWCNVMEDIYLSIKEYKDGITKNIIGPYQCGLR